MADRQGAHGAGNRHIVVIGASAGGLQALERLLPGLPADLPASVFVVLHLGATSHLAYILGLRSPLPVREAESGGMIEPGQVYVAVPGQHLLIHDSHLLLRRGPRENFARPAIDPLFRSAACSFGGAVIGVVLSGALNDGSAGLRAVKRCGGLAVVQCPEDAAVASMPRSAIRIAAADHVAPAAELGPLIGRLVRQPAAPTPPIPVDIRLETLIAAQELAGMKAEDALGKPSRFTCPECNGALWEIEDGSLLRFRCHVGHAYTSETVLSAQAEQAERMLWNLLRTHQERAALAWRMAAKEEAEHRLEIARRLQERAREYEEDAELVRRLIRERGATIDATGEQSGP
ncbi:MAG TPA: chemotaxis protein CheB [Rhodopila sp.]|nr:chemotaxis protein CheB [Rhodopila sp.]